MTRIAHLSDLHFGTEDEDVCNAIVEALGLLKPDLLAISGDLTQRARLKQFRSARRFLDRLPGRQLIVPGNHDVPLFNLPLRMFAPYRNYQRCFGDRQSAVVSAGDITLLGVDSTRPWRHKEGWLGRRGNTSIPARTRDLANSPVIGMLTHHPLRPTVTQGSGRSSRTSAATVARLYRLGVDFILCGHRHATGIEWLEPPADRGADSGPGIVQISAGTATSTRMRDEVNSFNLITTETRRDASVLLITEHYEYARGSDRFEAVSRQSARLPRYQSQEPQELL